MGGRIKLRWGSSFDSKSGVIEPFLRLKSDLRTTSPFPHAHHFPTDIQSKLGDSNFVHCSWRVRKLCLWGRDPQSSQGKVVSYAPRVHKVFIERAIVYTLVIRWFRNSHPMQSNIKKNEFCDITCNQSIVFFSFLDNRYMPSNCK